MWMQINQWWLSLESRERQLLQALIAFLIAVLVYLLVFKPIFDNKTAAQQSLNNAQQQWDWLNDQIPRLPKSNAPTKQKLNLTDSNALLAYVQQSLRSQNLFKDVETLKSISKGMEVSFESVQASRVFRWLSQLEQSGLVADKVQMTWLAADKVKAKIQFKSQ